MVKPEEPVEDHEGLLRTNYAPEHVIDGKVIVSAISSKDLKERGFSIDRELLADAVVIAERAKAQMEKDPEKRGEAHVSIFECRSIRAEVCKEDGKSASRY